MAGCNLNAPPNEPENLDELEAQIHSGIVPSWYEKSAGCEQQATFRVDGKFLAASLTLPGFPLCHRVPGAMTVAARVGGSSRRSRDESAVMQI
jgi:hypothetical protein